jgi:Ca-activated chloride channel family protein
VSRATRSRIATEIAAIASAGSTNMEAGLQPGYEVARASKAEFKGTTRVMLFTDERPNVGATQAGSFMAMAEAASRDGVGLTTIGVGVQFGAELATRISSVRGGNLFFFPDRAEMRKVFAQEWDTLVAELAHDFSIRIAPARGFRIAGVFGLPANTLRWEGDAIVMDVATIFLSQRKGGIFFALAPERSSTDLPLVEARRDETLAQVEFSYREVASGERRSGQVACRFLPPAEVQAGLSRGIRLVDEYLTLKQAAQLHLIVNDQERAFRLASGLLARFSAVRDPALAKERDLVREFHNNLAFLAGHASEVQYDDGKRGAALVGTWRRTDRNASETADEFLVVWPNGDIETVDVNRANRAVARSAVEHLPPRQVHGYPQRRRGCEPHRESG